MHDLAVGGTQPWWSPMACPACYERKGRDIWMVKLTVGPPERTIALKYECQCCGYEIPLTVADFPKAT